MFVEHKELGEVTEAPAKTLKLSEAIRIGAAMRPECVGCWSDGNGTCALGAAAEAVGVPYWQLKDHQNWWEKLRVATGVKSDILFQTFAKHDELRDRWQVADWLEAHGY